MTRLLILTLIACLIVFAAPISAQPGAAPFTVQETGEGFGSLAEAIDAIGDGEGTIVIAPGRYRQCAVQRGGRIAYVARDPGTALIEAPGCALSDEGIPNGLGDCAVPVAAQMATAIAATNAAVRTLAVRRFRSCARGCCGISISPEMTRISSRTCHSRTRKFAQSDTIGETIRKQTKLFAGARREDPARSGQARLVFSDSQWA